MSSFRIRDAAQLLGVSDDTMRRWADGGKIAIELDASGRRMVDGAELARLAKDRAASAPHIPLPGTLSVSARNRFVGLITHVTRDTVMAHVEMQSGVNRIVSLMSREAADELGLEPGILAVATIKATNVVIEVPVAPPQQ